MERTIRWLHVTDLHVGMDDQSWLWHRTRAKFRDDLEKICPTAGPWDWCSSPVTWSKKEGSMPNSRRSSKRSGVGLTS